MREFEEYKKTLIADNNSKIQALFLDQIQKACYMPCMKGAYQEDLTTTQLGCLETCSENYRMAEYIVTQCSNAKNAQAVSEE